MLEQSDASWVPLQKCICLAQRVFNWLPFQIDYTGLITFSESVLFLFSCLIAFNRKPDWSDQYSIRTKKPIQQLTFEHWNTQREFGHAPALPYVQNLESFQVYIQLNLQTSTASSIFYGPIQFIRRLPLPAAFSMPHSSFVGFHHRMQFICSIFSYTA